MANYLKMAQVQAILQLKDRGSPNRRIEKELGIHRITENLVKRPHNRWK